MTRHSGGAVRFSKNFSRAVWFNTVRLIITHYTRAHSPTTDGCEMMQQDTTTGALSLIPGTVQYLWE
jgi:hypothetical protein